jgi:hypothetical protein
MVTLSFDDSNRVDPALASSSFARSELTRKDSVAVSRRISTAARITREFTFNVPSAYPHVLRISGRKLTAIENTGIETS